MGPSLPYLCLQQIFDYINLDELINCFNAIDEWRPTIAHRLAKVEYFLSDRAYYGLNPRHFKDSQMRSIIYRDMEKSTLHQINNLLPNLKVFTITLRMFKKFKKNRFKYFFYYNKSIKGLILGPGVSELAYFRYCANLEMIALDTRLAPFRDGPFYKQHGYFTRIKQLYITRCDFSNDLLNYPNLVRLHVTSLHEKPFPILQAERGFKKLEILEFFICGVTCLIWITLFNECPLLRSAYLEISHAMYVYCARLLKKNYILQDLVLNYARNPEFGPTDIPEYKQKRSAIATFLATFPNVKHVAIRQHCLLNDSDVIEIIENLPNLVLLDLRGSTGITQKSVDYVRSVCATTGRDIKVYTNQNTDQIQTDWPNCKYDYERVSSGFDFMKNCFFKPFMYLPLFLVPEDSDA